MKIHIMVRDRVETERYKIHELLIVNGRVYLKAENDLEYRCEVDQIIYLDCLPEEE